MEWYQQALDGCEGAIGVGHACALSAIGSMAWGSAFYHHVEYGKALALDGRGTQKRCPSLDILNNMDLVFGKQEEYGKALELY